MLSLEMFAFLIVNTLFFDQSRPRWISSDASVEQMQLSPEEKIKVLPFVIEGSVETFDPIERANELEKRLPRKWCGTYKSFSYGFNLEVNLFFSQVKAKGQMVVLHGEILIDGIKAKILGNINAKSNHTEASHDLLVPYLCLLSPSVSVWIASSKFETSFSSFMDLGKL